MLINHYSADIIFIWLVPSLLDTESVEIVNSFTNPY